MKRKDGRTATQIRPVKLTRNYLQYPEGSVLIEMGNTKVICTACVSENVPPHKKNSGSGWVTAEYSMLPGATHERTNREQRTKGRTHEIQRLIGRSLRSIVELNKLGERTITIDADVIQADGGTRTAAITGSMIALQDAVKYLLKEGKIDRNPIRENIAAVSVGVVGGSACIDLAYDEDSQADVDMNVVMTESGKIVEVQGTAETEPFSKELLDAMLDMAQKGIHVLIKKQKETLAR
ncbi:MAG: ribonuclease PH [Candidatus Margulisbacteria bacterium]|nr:ribonuclease PH [Candidatus Margulisiibacteriota bacterium]